MFQSPPHRGVRTYFRLLYDQTKQNQFQSPPHRGVRTYKREIRRLHRNGLHVSIPSASWSPYLHNYKLLLSSEPFTPFQSPPHRGVRTYRIRRQPRGANAGKVSIPSASGSPYLQWRGLPHRGSSGQVSIPSASGSPYLLLGAESCYDDTLKFQSPPHRGVRTYDGRGMVTWWEAYRFQSPPHRGVRTYGQGDFNRRMVVAVFQSPPHRGVRTYIKEEALAACNAVSFNPLRIGESVLTRFDDSDCRTVS